MEQHTPKAIEKEERAAFFNLLTYQLIVACYQYEEALSTELGFQNL